jgi:uncharacterized protein (TIGR03435 family)
MKRTTTKITVMAGVAIVMAVAAAMVVKLHYFPAVKEVYFRPDFDNLRNVPAGVVSLRPTHTTREIGDPIRNLEEGGSLVRAVGRDVTFRNLIAEAYDCKPGRVVLPAAVPQADFDFLVTTAQPMEHLQSAIRKQLGYVARRETRSAEVLKLRLADANLSVLTASPDSEEESIQYKDGKLYFKHKTLGLLLAGLENGLNKPVLDETGLAGRYDFSLVWSQDIEQAMRRGAFDLEGVQKVLARVGLRLEPDTAVLDLVVVEKAR